jgi:TonB family protein
LRSSVVPLATADEQGTPGVGAAIPVHYAIELLQQMGISWHAALGALQPSDNPLGQAEGFSPPTPRSLVTSSYPSQALFGGEVVLDVLINGRGTLVDTKVVRGSSPFLEKVLSAVRSWSFFPARLGGHAVSARIGVTFQFSQSYEPPRTTTHDYDEALAGSTDRGPLPVVTVEPQYAATQGGDGSVILYDLIGRQGQLTATRILSDPESLSSAAVAAVRQWPFIPGRRAGTDINSTEIVVMAFRHFGSTPSSSQTK